MTENKPKVIVASPTFDKMKYCQDEFFNSIKNLSYSNYDILIVDNSDEDFYFEGLKKISGINVVRDKNIGKSGFQKVVSSRNKIIEYAIENNYDYIFMIDSDVIPPSNIIEELISCGKDLVSGLYFNFFNVNEQVKILPVAWREINEKEFEQLKKILNFDEKIKSHKDLRRHLTEEEIESNELLEVKYPSAGCMLISKEVFIKARYGLLDKENTSDDIYFFDEIASLGFKMYVYTKIKCRHLSLGKYHQKNGKFIHDGFGS